MSQTLKTLIPLAVVFSLLIATNFIYAAWSAPSGTPSAGNNASAPINVGSSSQVKNGNLGVNNLVVFGTTISDIVQSDSVRSTEYCDKDGNNCTNLGNGGSAVPPVQIGVVNITNGNDQWTTTEVLFNTPYVTPPDVTASIVSAQWWNNRVGDNAQYAVRVRSVRNTGFTVDAFNCSWCASGFRINAYSWIAVSND